MVDETAQPEASLRPQLWTRPFVALCASGYLAYASQTPIGPVIALWVVHLGGSATTVGLVAAAFSAPSFLFRPLVGRLCDTWSTRNVFAASCVISGLGSMLMIIPSLWTVFLSQTINGIGWAGVNTGGNTLVASLAPPERRGAATSYYQMSRGSLGFYLPYVCLQLKALVGYWLAFFSTAVAALIAVPLILSIPDRTRKKPGGASSISKEQRGLIDGLIERSAVFSSSMLFLAQMASPAVGTFIVLYALDLGMSEAQIGLLFVVRSGVGIAVQPLLSGVSDRFGRGKAIAFGLVTTAACMLMLSVATDFWWMVAAVVIASPGAAMTAPALQALAIDRAPPERQGSAMATYSLSFQLGAFVGSLAGGFLIDSIGFRAFYLVASLPACLALAFLFANWKTASIRSPVAAS